MIYVCGEAESGKLGIALDFRTQVAPKPMQLAVSAAVVACGGHHTLILGGKYLLKYLHCLSNIVIYYFYFINIDDGEIYCTGSNASGQLGMGTSVTEIQTPKQLPRGALEGETIKEIICGESHIAVVTGKQIYYYLLPIKSKVIL